MARNILVVILALLALLLSLANAQTGSEGRPEEEETRTRIRIRHSRRADTYGPAEGARRESRAVQPVKRSGSDHLHVRVRPWRGEDSAAQDTPSTNATSLQEDAAGLEARAVEVHIEASKGRQPQNYSNLDMADGAPSHDEPMRARALEDLDMELVISRLNEPLDWLAKVPAFYKVTIYNKGGAKHPLPPKPKNWGPERVYRAFTLPKVGGEANSFAEHLVRNYGNLAQYTIFSHGDPSLHNKHFLQLLEDPSELRAVQTMSAVYSYDVEDKYHTPLEAVEAMQKSPLYRSERTITRTLNAAWYHDEGAVLIQKSYRTAHDLPQGANLIRHHLGLLGLPEWMPEKQEICSFAFGGMIGFSRGMAMQHPRRVYDLLLMTTKGNPINAFVIERVWLVLLGGPDIED